jgi:hypothetical protein
LSGGFNKQNQFRENNNKEKQMLTSRITPGMSSLSSQMKKTNSAKQTFSGKKVPAKVTINGFAPKHRGRVEVNVDGTNILYPANITLKELIKSIIKLKNTRLGMYG